MSPGPAPSPLCFSCQGVRLSPTSPHSSHGQQPLTAAAPWQLPSPRGRMFGLLPPNPTLLCLPTGWQATVRLKKAQTGGRRFLGPRLLTRRTGAWQYRVAVSEASTRAEHAAEVGTRAGLGSAADVTASCSCLIAPRGSQQGMSQSPFWVRVFPLPSSSPPPFAIPEPHDCINTMSEKYSKLSKPCQEEHWLYNLPLAQQSALHAQGGHFA